MNTVGEAGDIFCVPLKDESWAVGQIISVHYGDLYVAVFGGRLSALKDDPISILHERPVFLTLTLDAKLFHGDWPIVGNFVDNLESFPLPAFKVGMSGVMHIESLDAKSTRKASQADIQRLRYRKVSFPSIIEEAIKAHFGLGEWKAYFDELRSDYAYSTAGLFAH